MKYNPPPYRRPGSPLRSLALMAIGGIATGAVFAALQVSRSSDQWLSGLGRLLNPPPPAPKVEVQSIVMQQIRNASELTTAAFTMQAIVPTSRDNTLGGLVVGTTKLLYVAYGEVEAGVDLSQLTPEKIQTTADTIQVELPPAQVLDSKIDVDRSNVYDYDRGLLGLGPDVAPDLQTLAQQEALKSIVIAACRDGILEKANDRAKLVVTQLLSTAGYQTVTVVTQPTSIEQCLAGTRGEETGNRDKRGE